MTGYTYDDKVAFVTNLYCPARQVADETGCSWELILAQAVQETGWGEKVLPGTNNIFNIKTDSSWNGESRMFNVWEVNSNGEKIWVNDLFRVYPTMLDSLRDRQEFLTKNARYARAGLFDIDVKGDFVSEAKALQKAGYATDPQYADQLEEIYKGKSMQRAIAAAKRKGCAGCLPVVNVRVLDAARQPMANAKIKVTQGTRTAELATDSSGHAQIQAAQSGGTVSVRVWSDHESQWVAVDGTIRPTSTPIAVTLVAPTVTIATSTDIHIQSAAAPTPEITALSGKLAASPDDRHCEIYTIRKGDSLSRIAKAHSTSYITLARLNGIESPYYVYPGQIIKVPLNDGAPVSANRTEHSGQLDTAASAADSNRSAPSVTPAAEQPRLTSTIQTAASGLRSSKALHVIRYRSEDDHPQTDLMLGRHAPWMEIAEREFKAGVRRRGGNHPDQHILEYFSATSTGRQRTDTIAYCAAFVNWCLTQSGYEGSHSAMANSFVKWGRPTRRNAPAYGAIAVVHFPEGGYHVTFVNGRPSNSSSRAMIATLGGNQGHAHEVSHSRLPASWVVHYRFPTAYFELDGDYDLNTTEVDSATMSAASTH